MTRICMYTPTADGGHARYAWELMTALTSQFGSQFELVTSENVEDQYRNTSYPVHAILPRVVHRREFASKLGWAINRVRHYPGCDRTFLKWLADRPDITGVHFQEHAAWRAKKLFESVRRLGKKVYCTVHNIRPHTYPPLISPRRVDAWNREAYQACDGLFVLTDRLATELKHFLCKAHPSIVVAPHGVWTVRDAGEMPALADRLAKKRLLFFGTIRRNKGLDVLLAAMEQLPGVSLTIAGEPRESDYYQNEIVPLVDRLRGNGVEIEVIPRFTPDDQVGKLFSASSALVLPYTNEFTAQSGVAFMALAYELPMVASRAGGLKDLFDAFAVGTQFESLHPDELARAINELLGSGSSRVITEIRAAKRELSWTNTAAATAELYGMPRLSTRRAA